MKTLLLVTSVLFSTIIQAEIVTEPHIMPDGTISWEQPDSTGWFGYEGYCGQTAAANISSMLRVSISPEEVNQTCYDVTPGSLPRTLARFLTNDLQVPWQVYHLYSHEAFAKLRMALHNGSLQAANGLAPVAMLIKVKGVKAYHWITIVDITDDDGVIFNEHGKQKYMTKKDLLPLWGFHGDYNPWLATLSDFGITPYTIVSQNFEFNSL